jgi:uncharacterized Zn-binding protein involved in type VI secretion
MRMAARITDPTAHGIPAVPGPGSANVLIGYMPAWRTILDTCVCPLPVAPPAPLPPHGPEKCYLGSTTVLVNFQMACRMGDILQAAGPPNTFAMGHVMTLIGDIGFGLGSQAAMNAFALAARDVIDNWDSLSPAERLQALQDALNDSLPPGVPPFNLSSSELPDRTMGEFDYQTWTMEVNEDLLNSSLTDDQAAELVNTVYHEGRHGEQWYNGAQYRAGQGQSAEQIENETYVPQHVAESAADNPAYPGSSESAMGESLDTSVYGDRGEYRGDVLGDDSDEGYEQYRALPEEEDAFNQGDAAEEAYRNLP